MLPRHVLFLLTGLALWTPQAARTAPPQAAAPKRTDHYGDALPPGAVARMGSVLYFHGLAPTKLAFSPDGKTLAVSGDSVDNLVRLLDVATGRQIRRLPGYIGTRSLHFSPDGRRVIATGYETIKIWDVATGEELHRIKGKGWTRDGKVLVSIVSAADSTTIRFSDIAADKELRRITLPHANIRAFAVTPDGKTLAGQSDSSLYVWDAVSGQELHRMAVGKTPLDWLAYSPDGKVLTSGSPKGGEVHVWDAATGKEMHRWGGYPDSHGSTPAFSPDGKTLAVPWRDETMEVESIRLWDVRSGKETGRIKVPHFGALGVAFSPDGKTLAWGIYGFEDTHRVRIWNLATGEERQPPGRLPEAVERIAFSPDGKTLLTTSLWHGPLRFWETATGVELRQFKEPKSFHAAAMSPSGTLWATGGEKLQLWDVAVGKEIKLRDPSPRYTNTLAFSPDGRLLAVVGDKKIRLWDMRTQKEILSLGKLRNTSVIHLGFTADGKTLLARTIDEDGVHIKLWDTATSKLLHQFKAPIPVAFDPFEKQTVHHLGLPFAFAPDGETVALITHEEGSLLMAREKRSIQLWDVAAEKEIRRMRVQANPSQCLAFSPDGRSLACAYEEKEDVIRLWEVATGQQRRQFEGHRQAIRCLAFSADGNLLATGAEDNTALVWDLTGQLEQGPAGQQDLSADRLRSSWADLAAKDAAVAYRAMCRLMAGRQTAAFLRKQLPPAPLLDARQREQVKRWIADLDSPRFEAREKAAAELERLGEPAGPVLRAALTGSPSLEVRRRVTPILEALDPARSPPRLQALRAVEVLERLQTPEARETLTALAGGAPEARLTKEAKASLERLAAPRKSSP